VPAAELAEIKAASPASQDIPSAGSKKLLCKEGKFDAFPLCQSQFLLLSSRGLNRQFNPPS
jgi:hypothetical protein